MFDSIRARYGYLLLVALCVRCIDPAEAHDSVRMQQSQGSYRLPFADGTQVKIFDDFDMHRPRGFIDLYAVGGKEPYRVVAAADATVMAIQDGYDEGRAPIIWRHAHPGCSGRHRSPRASETRRRRRCSS